MTRSKKPPVPPQWYDSRTPLEEQDPATQIAHEITTHRRDLAPSVDRIMTADLDAPQRHVAIELFRDSLREPADPHRDPRLAIEAARSTTS